MSASPHPASTPASLPLASLKAGQVASVRETLVDAADAAYLRAMGLRPGSQVRVCRLGEPVIVEVSGCGLAGCANGQVCGCRIGLSREIARKVMVEPVPP
ncbi:MAG: FeoA family protein [Phycisphaerales bacterium]